MGKEKISKHRVFERVFVFSTCSLELQQPWPFRFSDGGRVPVEQAHVTATASQGQQRGHALKSDRLRFGPCPYLCCLSLVLQRQRLRCGFGWKGFIRKVSKESWFCSREDAQGRGRGQMACGIKGRLSVTLAYLSQADVEAEGVTQGGCAHCRLECSIRMPSYLSIIS